MSLLRRNAPLILALAILLILAGLPILWMLVESIGLPYGLDFGAYGRILSTETMRAQLSNTVVLGVLAVALAVLLGTGTAFLCVRSDLPLGSWFGAAALLPLLFPPIIVAIAFDDWAKVKGLPAVALILAVSNAPFVVALTVRGLRSVDGRLYESVLLARGRLRAELMLLRQVMPDILAGALLVFVFTIANHGVPEFFSVKNKTWYTYSEAIFLKWGARGAGPGGTGASALMSPEAAAAKSSAEAVATSIPLLAITILGLWLCLRARKRGTLVTLASEFRPIPRRRLGGWRWPALAFVLILPALGLVMPAWRMILWTAGSMTHSEISTATFQDSFQQLFLRATGDLEITIVVALCVALTVVAVALPLAWSSARSRRPWIEALSLAPLAVPATLLGIGFIRVWNRPGAAIDIYDSELMLVMAYATRFLPIGVLALANAVRRVPVELGEAALLTGRGPFSRFFRTTLPLLLPAMVSAAILAYILSLRELDLAAVLLPGNDMLARRLSNIVHFNEENFGGSIALMLLGLAAVPLLLRILLTGRTGRAVE
jgi:iron(III) transport system permease protein